MSLRGSSRRATGQIVGVVAVVSSLFWGLRVSAEIEITEEDWENFIELDVDTPGTSPEPEIVETEDGVICLHLRGFPPGGADNDMFATYKLMVTQLPGGGPGPERFPITAVVRNAGGNAGMAIRNLTVGPIDDGLPFPNNIAQQESFVCVGIHADLGANVRALGTGPQPFDPCFDPLVEDPAGTIIVEPWGDAGQTVGVSPFTATDAPGAEVGVLETVEVMLDLVLGENILRIDSTDVRDLPCQYLGESGHQLFTLTIGAGEPDLKGHVVGECRVRRALGSSIFGAGETVEVTLTASNISGATTITETFPSTWAIADSGGGTVADNRITFTVSSDADLSYTLSVPADFCEEAELSGVYSGPGDSCEGDVGSTILRCVDLSGLDSIDFDDEGPTTTEELGDYFEFLGFDPNVGTNWSIEENSLHPVEISNALRTSSNDEHLQHFFSRVAVLRREAFEAQDLEFSADITWDDNDWAGLYFRFKGNSHDPFGNDYYYLKLKASGSPDFILHRVKDGIETEVARNDQIIINQGDTHRVTIEATGEEIVVRFNDEEVPGMAPFVDDDPILGPGRIGVGQQTNPGYFDNLEFVSRDEVEPAGASLRVGDVNGDGDFNLSDPVAHLGFLFSGGELLECYAAPGPAGLKLTEVGLAMLDFNGDGLQNLTDAVAALTSLFSGGPPHALGEGCAVFEGTCEAKCR